MSLQIDQKYTHLVSPRFEKFQRKSDYLYSCRCPLCGDSKKNKSKMRGYIYRKGNDLFYKCHNCGAGLSLGNLIKQLDPTLHKEYTLERYKSGEDNSQKSIREVVNVPTPKFDRISEDITYEHAERCDKLPRGHFCLDYLSKRKIPEQFYSKLYYTDNFKNFCDEVNPNHGKEKLTEDKRLVIPFYDTYNSLIAISGRALETSEYKLRYVTIRTDNSEEKLIFGMDRVKMQEKVLLVEGPIDSLFLNNCLASGDSSLALTAKHISAKDLVLVYDNEPRNKEIVKLMQDAIKSGHKVVIWPDNIEHKDINEMVMGGLSPDAIEQIISNNTFSDLEAQTKFIFWKKV